MKGIVVSPGIAIGKAHVLIHEEVVIDESLIGSDDELQEQIDKLNEAMRQTELQLNEIVAITEQRLSAAEADVFRAHLMILADPMLGDMILDKMRGGRLNVAKAVKEATDEAAALLAGLDDEYMRERVADIHDVGGRLLNNVTGNVRESLDSLSEEVIVVAHDLTPSDTAVMDMRHVKGFITEVGGRTSHTSIIARIMGLPAIVGTGDVLGRVGHGDFVVLDAVDGDFIVRPDAGQLKAAEAKRAVFEEKRRLLDAVKMLPAQTVDGRLVEIAGNIAAPGDIKGVKENGGEGVGLFRTEFLYMNRSILPTEEEQYAVYKEVAEGTKEHYTIVRTLDIGGDKAADCIKFPAELNPFLGWRGVRIYFDRPDIIKPQLRAILRASAHGRLLIMYPMIISAEEIIKMREVIEECKGELRAEGLAFDEKIEVGIMVETPAAAFNADLLADIVDFFSIGSNDLTQYVLAVDRGNDMIADLYQPLHPALIRAIKQVIDASHKVGKWTGVCGELAGEEKGAIILLGLGLDEFSMSAGSIPTVKNLIRKSSYERVKQVAEECLNMRTTQEVEERIDALLAEIYKD